MKPLIVYVSVEHGNTEKVARAMAEVLEADLKKADEVDPSTISNYELVGFGSGIFKSKFHARLLRLVQEMPVTKGAAFVFSTGGYGYRRFNASLIELLKMKGMEVKGDFACKGWDTYGFLNLMGGINKDRPNAEDLDDARRFAKGLMSG
jgi:flavodoxin